MEIRDARWSPLPVSARRDRLVRTRSLLCYRGVREPGLSPADLAGRSGGSGPNVGVPVRREAQIGDRESLEMVGLSNVKI